MLCKLITYCIIINKSLSIAPLAQRTERIASDDEVGGSNPSRRASGDRSSMVERQPVELYVAGSSPVDHPKQSLLFWLGQN